MQGFGPDEQAGGALSASDVIAGQAIVQLGLLPAAEVRRLLQVIAADPFSPRDLVNRLVDGGRLSDDAAELVRHRVALYFHVWLEDCYTRRLEQRCSVPKAVIVDMLLELERSAYRDRLGSQLVRFRKLTPELDQSIHSEARANLRGLQEQLLDAHLALVDHKRLAALRVMDTPIPAATPARTAPPSPAPPAPEPPTTPAEQEADPAASLPPGPTRALDDPEALEDLRWIGEYEVLEVLGRGGMGAVYLCRPPGGDEAATCAVKVLLNSAASEAEVGRFKREIELTGKIDHPTVIDLLDSGETENGLTYLVVPSLFGKELRWHLTQHQFQGLPPALTCTIFEQLLRGLQAVHELGIVHRDLKPENVFVLPEEDGSVDVRLIDFGVAKYIDEAFVEGSCFRTLHREVIGTPAYLSPDAITNDKIDGRTDLYSLGIMLFEMLTGELPLKATTPEAYVGQHLICPPLTLEKAQPQRAWPEELQALLTRMLGKSRKKRPDSCAEILALLDGGLRDQILALEGPPGAAEMTLAEMTLVDIDEEDDARPVEGLLGRLAGATIAVSTE
jgi:hypothetical protein